jgi:hypothetical protein
MTNRAICAVAVAGAIALAIMATLLVNPHREYGLVTTLGRFEELHELIDTGYVQRGVWPPSLDGVTRSAPAEHRAWLTHDHWRTAIHVIPEPDAYRLVSAGRDRRFGSIDDIERRYTRPKVRQR